MPNNQFVARNGIISLDDVIVTGSITATGGINISGSIASASYATSASQAQTAVSSSYPFVVSGSVIYTTTGVPYPSKNYNTPTIAIGKDIGSGSLLLVSNAGYNIYIGHEVALASTESSDAIAIGTQAAYQLQNDPTSTVMIGSYAGFQGRNLYWSTLLGYEVAKRTNDSEESTIIGYGAAGYANKLNKSVLLGTGVASSMNTGSLTTAIGYYSLGDSERSIGSVLMGAWTGYNLTSGSNNIIIGPYSGRNVTLKRNNIIIGTNISLPANAQDSINIGGLIFGTGSAWVGVNSTYDNYTSDPFSGSANGKIGINQPTPQYNLDVSGSGNYTNGLTVTGSVVATSFTGSILGTGSYALQALTSSYAANADLLDNRDSTTFANTGSNNFTGTQQVSATNNAISFTSTASFYTDGGMRITKDMYVSGNAFFNNVTVYGTQSINYITSSQLNISTNIISVNTDTPAIRFGGLSVYDSGSTKLTGSLLWDSEKDRWVYSNPSGSSYDGGMLISGPRNTSGLGNEQGTTACALMMGQGADHITSSAIFSYGNATCFYGNATITSTGVGCFASTVCAPTFLSSGTICSTGNTCFGGNTFVAGNVGINTTSPGYKLQVNGSSSGTVALFAYNGAFAGTCESNIGLRWYCGNNDSDIPQIKLRGYGTSNYTGNFAIDIMCQGTYPNTFAERFTIQGTTGNVGIGITSPSKALDVVGSGKFSDGTQGLLVQAFTGGSGFGAIYPSTVTPSNTNHAFAASNNSTVINVTGSGVIDFEIGTNSKMYITNAGNIGIGTISPNTYPGFTNLQVSGSTYGLVQVTGTSNTIGSFYAGNCRAFIGTTSAHPFTLFTCDVERIRITSDGFVGIGTINPLVKLTVQDDATFCNTLDNGQFRIQGNTSCAKKLFLGVDTSCSTAFGYIQATETGVSVRSLILQPSGGQVGIGMNTPCSNVGKWLWLGDRTALVDDLVATSYLMNNATFCGVFQRVRNGYASNITLDANGDFNISMSGCSTAGSTACFTNMFVVKNSGKVGIGANTPQQILSVNNPFSSLDALYPVIISQTGNAEIGGIYSTADSITNPIGAGLAFKTYQINVGLTEKLRITHGGYVGIGCTAPSGKLQVANSSTQYALYTLGGNLELYTPEGNCGYVRLGSAYNLNGVYGSCGLNYIVSGTSAHAFRTTDNNTERLRIFSTGEACFSCQVCAPSGVKFGNGSSTLNYYEQGTWTPRVTNGSFTTNAGTENAAWYVRVGNIVTVGGTLSWSGGTGAQDGNSLRIGCLPFASNSGTNYRNVGQFGAPALNSIGFKNACAQMTLVIDPGASFIYIIENYQSGTYLTYTHSPCAANAGTVYGFQATYQI